MKLFDLTWWIAIIKLEYLNYNDIISIFGSPWSQLWSCQSYSCGLTYEDGLCHRQWPHILRNCPTAIGNILVKIFNEKFPKINLGWQNMFASEHQTWLEQTFRMQFRVQFDNLNRRNLHFKDVHNHNLMHSFVNPN